MMFDTIKIKIPDNLFKIGDDFYFNQTTTSGENGYTNIKRSFNQTFIKEQKQKGIYVPQYHLEHNKYGGVEKRYLVLQISLPKLLYGSSIYEVKSFEWDTVRDRIIEFLATISVEVTAYSVAHSIITSLSFAKNIDLQGWCSPSQAIELLARFNYLPRSECNLKLIQGKMGAILKYFNYNTALTFYDKLPEIVKNAKTDIEKTIAQEYTRYLKGELKYKPRFRLEILRVEATLQTKTAVIQKAQRFFHTKKTEFTLYELFNYDFCKNVLSNEVKKVLEHPLKKIILLSGFEKPIIREQINKICKNSHSRAELIEAVNRVSNIGFAPYREELLNTYSERTWFRRQGQLRELSSRLEIPIDENLGRSSTELIDYILKQFD